MFILDTNVVSELRKVEAGKADAGLTSWSRKVASVDLYLSVITIEELEIGILLIERRDAAQGALLRAWMNLHVLPTFRDRILPVDVRVVLRSAALNVPDPYPIRDGFIAATALVHGMTVVTRNTGDFVRAGVRTLNPWEYREDD
jgi:predicted nucleic acid-binding protein